MFLLSWARGQTEPTSPPPGSPPYSAGDSESTDAADVESTTENCQNSSSSLPPESTPEYCAVCQQANVTFPEASPWDNSSAPPPICIACVLQSSSIAETGRVNSYTFQSSDFGTSHLGNPLRCIPCVACHWLQSSSGFPDRHIVESCRHYPEVCLSCIEESIIESLNNDLPQCISCPQCGDAMPELDIQRFCGDKTFQRYRKMIQLVKFQECAVCTESIHVSQFPEAGVTESCTHAPSTCLECIRHHIESQLETRMWNQLSCPECPALLGYADVRKYASKPTFERYDSLLMRDGISSDLNFRWCTAGCGSGQVHLEGSESPLMICNSCRALSCFTHQSPWHEGKTCVEFDNLEGAEDKPEGSSPREYGKLLSNLAEIVGPSRKIFVGGVKRKETDQERKDRKLAMRLSKEQEKEDKKRRQRIEQEDRNRVQAEEAGQQEAQRHAREVEEEREREERELRQQREEKQCQARRARQAQQIRARQQKEESASSSVLQTNTKACPGNCGWRIEKNDGCDHMTCWDP